MRLKGHADSDDKANAKKRSPWPATPELALVGGGLHRELIIHRALRNPRELSSRDVMQLQRSIGNRAVATLLRETTPDEPTRTVPRRIGIPIGPSQAVVFRTATATLGAVDAYVTGRLAIQGNASLIGEELPKKEADVALRTRVHDLVKDGFNAAKPSGTATKIEASLGGETLVLELADGAERSPAFQVSGHFSAKGRNLAVAGCEVKGAAITLDATVWIAPVKPPTPDAAQTRGFVPGDASVKQFSFASDEARFEDKEGKSKERSGGVTLKTAMDSFEAKLPLLVKEQAYLRLPEQRAAFFQHMRAYFGTDEKTVEHFSKLRKAGIKGATTWLHDEAATRLEKVQEELTEANMPSSGGVGWPRSECNLSSKQNIGNLHNIGFAVDYNAYQTPHLKDQKILDLVQLVTGHSATANYGSPAGIDVRSVGATLTSGTTEEKGKLEADPRIQKWLDQVGHEAEAVGKASEDFRASLKTTDDKGVEVDLAATLKELRKKWFAAEKDADKQAILAELPTVLKPWLDKVATEKKAVETNIKSAGLEPEKLPAGNNLQAAISAAQQLAKPLKALLDKLGIDLKKGQRAQVDQLLGRARKLLDEDGDKPVDDAAAVAELRRLAELVAKRQTALIQKKWLDRVNTLNSALTGNASFVFGKGSAKQVSDPALAQMVDIGFFTLRGTPTAGKEAFDVNFVKSMVKHGFTHGATWSTPDLMHFELRWKGPGN